MARSSWVMIGLSFVMKCLCPHSCLRSVSNTQLLFLNFSVGGTSFLHLDLKYAESPFPGNVLPALTPLPCIPNLHRFTCVMGTRRCPLKSLFGFCHFLCFSNLFLAFVCPLCFYFASCVCSLLFCMSICVAMVGAHQVEQGPRVCPRLMVVLTQTLFVWAVAFFLLDHKGKYFSVARGCPRLMVVLTQTLFIWAVAFSLLDHKDKYFSMARGCVLG